MCTPTVGEPLYLGTRLHRQETLRGSRVVEEESTWARQAETYTPGRQGPTGPRLKNSTAYSGDRRYVILIGKC